jgi:hypothetical protein
MLAALCFRSSRARWGADAGKAASSDCIVAQLLGSRPATGMRLRMAEAAQAIAMSVWHFRSDVRH